MTSDQRGDRSHPPPNGNSVRESSQTDNAYLKLLVELSRNVSKHLAAYHVSVLLVGSFERQEELPADLLECNTAFFRRRLALGLKHSERIKRLEGVCPSSESSVVAGGLLLLGSGNSFGSVYTLTECTRRTEKS